MLALAIPRMIQGQAVALGCCGTIERMQARQEHYLGIMREWIGKALRGANTRG